MSEPQNIEQKKERRRSIALLTRSPLSHSPNPSPRNSLPNSYVNNSSFLRSDSYNNNNNDSGLSIPLDKSIFSFSFKFVLISDDS